MRELVDLGLRYDLTVPLTRFYGNNHASLPTPFRSLQVGPVWRADRPQKGRYRQFYQCDIDMIGEPSVLAEAELIEATTEALAAIGLTGTTVRVSDRRFLAALAAECGVPARRRPRSSSRVDKLDKIGWDGFGPSWLELGFDRGAGRGGGGEDPGLTDVPADKLAGALAEACPGWRRRWSRTCPRRRPARPAGQGTGAGLGVRSDAGARDGVLHRAGVRDHPPGHERVGGRRRAVRQADRAVAGARRAACGFSIGFERIVDLLARGQARDAVAVLVEGDVPVADALAVAREMRCLAGPGRVVETVRRSGKFGAQLKRLEAAGFSGFVLVRYEDGVTVRGELRNWAASRGRRPERGQRPNGIGVIAAGGSLSYSLAKS